MATQILAVGSTAANSSDVTVAAGESLTVALKGATDPTAVVVVELKDDASAYQIIDRLDSNSRKALVINGAGVYRFRRLAGGTCGVFSG